MTGARVAAQGVSRSYGEGAQRVEALRDVNLEVAPGEFVALVGRSGSGKTTLLNLIAGLDRPSSGHILIDEVDVSACSEDQLTQLRRRRIGFVFQSFGLLPLLSALENVELALRIAGAGRGDRTRRAREVLSLVGLSRRLQHRPYELSGGEQQRVAIARALANRPSLILADEPTGELDSTTAATIFRLLREVVRGEGVTLITSTHDATVMEVAGRVEELADGQVVPPDRRTLLRYVAERQARLLEERGTPPQPQEVRGGQMPLVAEAPHAPQPALGNGLSPAPLGESDATAEDAADADADLDRWAPPERREAR